MAETPEAVYRAAAEANDLVRPGRITVYTDVLATSLDFRAAVDAAYAAGREAAAQAIRDHADKHAPERASAMRRHLHIAARVAAGPMTDAQMIEAIQRGDFAVCHLDEAGRPIGGEDRG